ncbi:MAG TPA: hypothetical protein VFD32_08910, partial [Dehalococcoidia bacterium]|nr:hypothetical protein [Dehalococcoidia bacterium]
TTMAKVEPVYSIGVLNEGHEPGIAELRLPSTLTQQERVERRRAAFATLGSAVRPLLTRLGGVPFTAQELTVYDAIYAATPEIGGFWTIANRVFGLLGHQIASYTVSLAFDEQDRPRCFVISGAIVVKSEDASPAALDAAIEQARRAGPLRTAARHALTGFGL